VVDARGKTKNEDEVNDIHAGYRILLPSRPRLPSSRLFLFLLSSRSLLFSLSPLNISYKWTLRLLVLYIIEIITSV